MSPDAALPLGRSALQLLTRTATARATATHLAVIGHITAAELRHQTKSLELATGRSAADRLNPISVPGPVTRALL